MDLETYEKKSSEKSEDESVLDKEVKEKQPKSAETSTENVISNLKFLFEIIS